MMTITIERPGQTNVFNAGLPTLEYQSAPGPEEAHAIIANARRQAPIALAPHGPELLTYDLVREALRDSTFRVPRGFVLAAQGITSGPLWDRAASNILSLDGAEHNRLRRLVAKVFTPKAAERLRATAVDVINELVDPLVTTGRCDLVADVATQYPIPIICALLGAPRQDWKLFSRWADDVLKAFFWNAAEDTPVVLRAWDELDAYVDDMVAERRKSLTGDLISDLIRAEDDGDRLTHDELLMMVSGLLIAGTDTTRNQLAASAHVLIQQPDQWALLARQPDLAQKAVEETMRHSPIAFTTMRTPVDDVELVGLSIPAGTLVLVNTAAANRDPAAYDDPDRLDITRTSPPAMLTFGGGMHYCLGVHLARIELAEALTVITRRMPNARVTGPVPWKPLTGMTGPAALPIEFDAEH
jgi:cytochrome P450